MIGRECRANLEVGGHASVDRFGELAKAGTTVILPANVADVASMVTTALRVFKQEKQSGG